MENSSQFTDVSLEEIQKIMKTKFNILVKSMEIMKNGWENTNLKLTCENNSHLVLRIAGFSKRKTYEYVNFEVQVLNYLNSKSMSVPRIIKCQDEEIFQIYGKNCLLYEFYNGKHAEFYKITESHVQLIGNFLGKLHKNTSNFSVGSCKFSRKMEGYDPEDIEEIEENIKSFPYDESLSYLKNELLSIFNDHDFINSDFRENFETFQNKFPQGVIHSDIHEMNVLFNETEDEKTELSVVLDWDDCKIGPFIYDICYTIMSWCGINSKGKYELNVQRVSLFLESYQKEREIEEIEFKFIKEFMVYSYFDVLDFCLLPANHHRKKDISEVLEMYVQYTKQIQSGKFDEIFKIK